MTVRDFKRAERGKLRWIVVSGNKDFNYAATLETGKAWEDEHLPYRFLDVPGMGHAPADAASMKEAMAWVAAGKSER